MNYKFTGKLDGQHRKDGSNKKLSELLKWKEMFDTEEEEWIFGPFTPFYMGLTETIDWYKENKEKN